MVCVGGDRVAEPALEFFVMRNGVNWKVRLEYCARCTSAEAFEAAVEAAHAAGKSGIPARVVMRSDDGSWLPVWTYGMDPYPLGQRW
jgi:hypothetical protein